MNKPKAGLFPDTLACVDEKCNQTQTAPTHCGASIHIEGDNLLCCMVSECSSTRLSSYQNVSYNVYRTSCLLL